MFTKNDRSTTDPSSARLWPVLMLLAMALILAGPVLLAQDDMAAMEDELAMEAAEDLGPRFRLGLEAKFHARDSELFFDLVNLPTPDGQIAGQAPFQSVNEGSHLELSVVTVTFGADWGELLEAFAKVDVIDLYDRNPTSGDRTVDVDEAWVRFGRAWFPALPPERPGVYVKVGKMAKFERQNDRHLESYGLVSTAFNRFEDVGIELGADLGRHFYVKATATQGNPVFFRDPNALAGDNGTDEFLGAMPDPALGSGVLVLYDAETEDIDVDGDLEVGVALGVRGGDASGLRAFDLMVFGYERTLADSVELEGTFYGGDLDLLRGPFNVASLPISGDEKTEYGANLWLYLGGFSLFAQYVDQEIAGLERTGGELELAYRFDLPLRWAVGGSQLFPWIAPAARYSQLDPEFGGNPLFPAPSVAWDWEKIDYGLRLGIVDRIDLTLEYADNTFTKANGEDLSNDEFLATLRFGFMKDW